MREQLDRLGAGPNLVKDVAGRMGGWGMILFARVNPDTPGKLTMHAHAYEHMELAAYELLRRIAERAGDERVAAMARTIGGQERARADRLGGTWDRAVEASLRQKGADHIADDLVKYLRDAHALDPRRCSCCRRARGSPGSTPSLNSSASASSRPASTTPAKLAGFAYAFEALETGAYELLMRVARRAGDEETAAVAERILGEERAAERVAATWDEAAELAVREPAGA